MTYLGMHVNLQKEQIEHVCVTSFAPVLTLWTLLLNEYMTIEIDSSETYNLSILA